ncbi:MAG: hypothetical protein K9N06_08975 [Candidatus Cloacimonetes bacterium]|nr:hypothetical protein [Candidatus Cloacimonadota bacterium]
MNSNLKILVEMQKCDDKITELKVLMEKLPEQLSTLKRNQVIAKEHLAEVKKHIEVNKMEQDSRYLKTRVNKDQIGKYQNQLLTIETNKEYKALNKEVSHLEQANTALEDEIVVLMEEAEELVLTQKKVEKSLQEAQAELQANEKKLEAEIDEVKKDVDQYREQRKALAVDLPISLVKKYAGLIKNRNSKAVVFSIGDACGGCGFKIRPQVMVDLHEGENIISCESCSRILVYNSEE